MPLWFRAYNETIDDRKLIHLARSVGLPQAMILGAWWVILTLGNLTDEERGYCVVDSETRLTREDLIGELGRVGVPKAAEVFDGFIKRGLLEWSEEHKAYWIPHFADRQFMSDSSTQRVREWRARKKQQGNKDATPDETLQERSCNGPETETKTETKTKTKTKTETQAYMHGACAAFEEPGLIAFLAKQGADDPEALAEVWSWGEGDTRQYFRMFEYRDPAVKSIENPIGYAIHLQREGVGPPQPRARDPDDRTRFAGPGVES